MTLERLRWRTRRECARRVWSVMQGGCAQQLAHQDACILVERLQGCGKSVNNARAFEVHIILQIEKNRWRRHGCRPSPCSAQFEFTTFRANFFFEMAVLILERRQTLGLIDNQDTATRLPCCRKHLLQHRKVGVKIRFHFNDLNIACRNCSRAAGQRCVINELAAV